MHVSNHRAFSRFLQMVALLVLVAFCSSRTGSETMPPAFALS
jgi:hypothetical protein